METRRAASRSRPVRWRNSMVALKYVGSMSPFWPALTSSGCELSICALSLPMVMQRFLRTALHSNGPTCLPSSSKVMSPMAPKSIGGHFPLSPSVFSTHAWPSTPSSTPSSLTFSAEAAFPVAAANCAASLLRSSSSALAFSAAALASSSRSSSSSNSCGCLCMRLLPPTTILDKPNSSSSLLPTEGVTARAGHPQRRPVVVCVCIIILASASALALAALAAASMSLGYTWGLRSGSKYSRRSLGSSLPPCSTFDSSFSTLSLSSSGTTMNPNDDDVEDDEEGGGGRSCCFVFFALTGPAVHEA
mmetsp:Transcript_50763/g.93870  ORF Transcript_50763/g.93870 Transcript_50763/m.93870 type:complete len:304 (-) Transcript_50763:467-1378(-)